MSLYYETSTLIADKSADGSLKSRVFGSKLPRESQPRHVYALASEAAKWSGVLSEVIEKADLLRLERKLSPELALLLVHDLLLNKKGIAAPTRHPLRLIVEKHKARLNAEFTRVRLRNGCKDKDGLRNYVEESLRKRGDASSVWHPRWVRVNTIKTDLMTQLQTTFKEYQQVDNLEKLERAENMALVIDKHVPNLLALPSKIDLTKSSAYLDGLLILQDKASCFSALLLDPARWDGNVVDACAAPGNKTTHVASLMQDKKGANIHACERDKTRAESLAKLVNVAGAGKMVRIQAGQDFLRVKPEEPPWNSVHAVLLDPSCSGSGMIGRDEPLSIVLPKKPSIKDVTSDKNKKRKRDDRAVKNDSPAIATHQADDQAFRPLSDRLSALSTIQLKLLLHAFSFPSARCVTYSTCSIYDEENEHVVMTALSSDIARERRWRIMRLHEQHKGLQEWPVRGRIDACRIKRPVIELDVQEIAQSCIRCEKGSSEGTQGFFVAGFVRDVEGQEKAADAEEDMDEFSGFQD